LTTHPAPAMNWPANKIGEIWQHGGDVTLDISTT
jgi:hypothetical protein